VHKIRVYVDTSVFGGTQDEEFAESSKRFLERVMEGEYRLLISSITHDELESAPAEVRGIVENLTQGTYEEIDLDEEMWELANAYISAGALGRASEYDALHVAAATVAKADLILSWNFRHIVNYDRIKKFNAVNLLNGYKMMDIRSPREVEYGDKDQDV